jgi:hypothetical protein
MTALSCLALGLAFGIAVALLLFAGVTIGFLLPPRLRARRSSKGAPPRPDGQDSLTPPASRD